MTADPAKRRQIYEDVNRRFGSQVWNFWVTFTLWGIGTAPDVHGVDLDEQPALPNGEEPFPGLATGEWVHGFWIER